MVEDADQESREEGEALLGMQSQEASPSLLVRFQMSEINPRIWSSKDALGYIPLRAREEFYF